MSINGFQQLEESAPMFREFCKVLTDHGQCRLEHSFEHCGNLRDQQPLENDWSTKDSIYDAKDVLDIPAVS